MAFRIPLSMKRLPKRRKQIDLIKKWHIYRGDKVAVIAGPDKGLEGKVIEVVKKKNAVVLDGINMSQRSIKATPLAAGKYYMAPSPMHYSNVNLVDPTTGKPTRIRYMFGEDGTKVRVAKKSGSVIPYPEEMKKRRTPRSTETGPLDTPPELVLERTV